jgi:pimeloyl-ACP methyl ester carboxylesterase
MAHHTHLVVAPSINITVLRWLKNVAIFIGIVTLMFVLSEIKLFDIDPKFESSQRPMPNIRIESHMIVYGQLNRAASVKSVKIEYSLVTHIKNQASPKPILILVHGFPEIGKIAFEPIYALAENYTLVVPDLRGYGNSEVQAPVESVDDYSVDVAVQDLLLLIRDAVYEKFIASTKNVDISQQQIMDAAHIFAEVESANMKVNIVGHDSGGLVVWKLLELYPQKFDKAIILTTPHPAAYKQSTTPDFYSDLWIRQLWKSRYAFYFASDLFVNFMSMHNWAWLDKAALAYGKFSKFDVDVLHTYWNRRMTTMVMWYRHMLNTPSTSNSLPEGRNVLIVKPETDFAFESETVDASCAFVKGECKIVTVPDANHFLVHDQPEAIMKILNEYLQN